MGYLTSWGCYPEDVPGLMVTIATIHLTLEWELVAIAKGGRAITDALVSAGRKLGVDYHLNSEVQRVRMEMAGPPG